MRLLPLLLLACDPGDSGDTDGKDTDSGEPTDTADTGDSGDTGDSALPADMGFDVDADAIGATLTLTPLDMTSLGSEELRLEDTWFSAPVDADPFEVHVGEPPPEALVEADPENAPGMLVAMYVPALHADADGDGLPSGDEAYIGAGLWWAAYITGEIGPNYTALGVVDGWNAVYLFGEMGPEFGSAMTIPLPSALAPDTQLTLGGTYDGPLEGIGLAALPWSYLNGDPVAAFLYDAPIEATWSISFDGEPAADHFAYIDNFGDDVALELVASYADNDSSGDFSGGDSIMNPPCFEGTPVAALWWPGPGDLLVALQMVMQGMRPGWIALPMGDGGGGGLLTDEQAQSLSISETCTFD